VDGRRAGEAAGKSEANQVPAKVEEKVAESRAAKSISDRAQDDALGL